MMELAIQDTLELRGVQMGLRSNMYQYAILGSGEAKLNLLPSLGEEDAGVCEV